MHAKSVQLFSVFEGKNSQYKETAIGINRISVNNIFTRYLVNTGRSRKKSAKELKPVDILD